MKLRLLLVESRSDEEFRAELAERGSLEVAVFFLAPEASSTSQLRALTRFDGKPFELFTEITPAGDRALRRHGGTLSLTGTASEVAQELKGLVDKATQGVTVEAE